MSGAFRRLANGVAWAPIWSVKTLSIFAAAFLMSTFSCGIHQTAFPQAIPTERATGARAAAERTRRQWTETLNSNTVSVISGNPNGAYLYLAYDLSAVLDDGQELRILPMIGKGAYSNIADVLHLKGVDLGLSRTDVMSHLAATNEFGGNIKGRITYIAKIYNEEMQILAGPGIEKLEDLNGKKVNFSDAGSGSQFTTRKVFAALGIKPIEVNMGQNDAYVKMKSGELAATILVSGKPSGSFKNFVKFEGAKVLPVPFDDVLARDYFPAELTHDDYPNLLEEGQSVNTIAVGAVLVAFNWKQDNERYRRVARFIDRFFSNFEKFLKPPRHPKWRETNLAAEFKGWTRHPRAAELLKKIENERKAAQQRAQAIGTQTSSGAPIDTELAFRQAAGGNAIKQQKLFEQFLEWVERQNN